MCIRDRLHEDLVKARIHLSKTKQRFAVYTSTYERSTEHIREYEIVKELYFRAREKVRQIEKQIRTLQRYFRVKGEGEVNVLKKVYPNTMIQIKGEIKEITCLLYTSRCV